MKFLCVGFLGTGPMTLQTFAISREDFRELGQALAERHMLTSVGNWRFSPDDCEQIQVGKGYSVTTASGKRFPTGVYKVRIESPVS